MPEENTNNTPNSEHTNNTPPPQDPPQDPPPDPKDDIKESDKGGDAPKKDDKPGENKTSDNKPTDEEARLLKDVMKHKNRAKELETRLKELEQKFEGVDPEKARQMLEEAEKAEEEARIARGEFDAVKQQMVERHNAELSKKDEEIKALNEKLSKSSAQVEELTIGTAFGMSSFIQENTVLTPSKARKLYADHFDIGENGEVVGYDKPRGAANRAPLVNSAGDPVPFNDAIQRVIEADPDKDRLLRSSLKEGAQSAPAAGKRNEAPKPKSSLEKISSGLNNLTKQ